MEECYFLPVTLLKLTLLHGCFFFKLYIWYQIAQRITYISELCQNEDESWHLLLFCLDLKMRLSKKSYLLKELFGLFAKRVC